MTSVTRPGTTPRAGRLLTGIGDHVGAAIARVRLPLAVTLYLLAVILPISFRVGPLMLTGVRTLLILLIVPMSIRLLSGAYGRVLLVDVLMFLHALWFTIALAINSPEQAVMNSGSTGIEFIGGYVLGRACIRDRETFTALVRAMALIALFLLPFIIIETLTGRALVLQLLNSLPGVNSIPEVDIGKRLGLFRVQAVFAHPIHSGLFFVLTFSLCFLGLKGVYGEGRRWFIGAICALSGFLALSSGALLALVLQFGLIIWARMFRHNRKRWWLLLALFGVFYVVIDLLSNRTPIQVFMSYATFSSHTAFWRSLIFDFGMDNVWANPFFGIGLNDWVRPSWMYTASVDNFWLLVAMRYGIPGFLFLAAGYLWALWKIGARAFDADIALWNLRRAWMFSFVGLTFTLCTVHVWHSMFSFVFFMFGAGMWFLHAVPATEKETEPRAATPAPRQLRHTRFPPGRRPSSPLTPARGPGPASPGENGARAGRRAPA